MKEAAKLLELLHREFPTDGAHCHSLTWDGRALRVSVWLKIGTDPLFKIMLFILDERDLELSAQEIFDMIKILPEAE